MEAIPLLQFAETLCDQNSDQAYETIANIHFCISSVLSILRDFERVKWHCEKNLEMRLSALEQDDMQLSIAYNDMGFYYLCVNLFEEALSAFQMSLNTSSKLEISKNGTYLAVNPKINSATALLGLGRFEEADEMVSRCLEQQERTWGVMNTRSFA
jgi:tetratricopeptide (TPR) repeat protein